MLIQMTVAAGGSREQQGSASEEATIGLPKASLRLFFSLVIDISMLFILFIFFSAINLYLYIYLPVNCRFDLQLLFFWQSK
jgi:hypothetical protein